MSNFAMDNCQDVGNTPLVSDSQDMNTFKRLGLDAGGYAGYARQNVSGVNPTLSQA